MTINFLQIINPFTLLDVFLLPRISNMVNKIAQYRVLSKALLIFKAHIIKCHARMKTSPTLPLKLEAISISSLAFPLESPME